MRLDLLGFPQGLLGLETGRSGGNYGIREESRCVATLLITNGIIDEGGYIFK